MNILCQLESLLVDIKEFLKIKKELKILPNIVYMTASLLSSTVFENPKSAILILELWIKIF